MAPQTANSQTASSAALTTSNATPETKGEIRTRPQGGQQPTTHWGSTKRQRTLSMSDKGWDVACALAETTRTNRSEICEVALRVLAMTLENGQRFDQLRLDALERDNSQTANSLPSLRDGSAA